MTSGIWLSAVFVTLPFAGSPAEVTVSPACTYQCAPRDPIVFNPGEFSHFLNEMSTAPDVRISIAAARLNYHETYSRTRVADRPPTRWRLRIKGQKVVRRRLTDIQLANQALIRATAVSYALDPQYMIDLARRESQFNHLARAPTSSATGLFQFTENTWLCVVRKYGSTLSIAEAGAVIRTASGRCRPPSLLARWRLLGLRYDPKLNATMAALHTRENASALHGMLGRRPDASELYAFYFFGADEGERFLRAPLSARADRITPRAAASNRTLFYDRRGRARSIQEIRSHMKASFTNI